MASGDDQWRGRSDEHGRDAGYRDYDRSRGDEYDDEPRSRQPDIPNNLAFSIFVTLCCCVPFGIVAIVYASQVNGHLSSGRYSEARAAAEASKKWATIGMIVGIIVGILNGILQVVVMQNANNGRGF